MAANQISSSSPVLTDEIMNEVYQDAGRYVGIDPVPLPNLSGITAYTRNTNQVIWASPQGWSEWLNIDSPRIIFRVNNNPKVPVPVPFPWRFRRMTNGKVGTLSRNDYVIDQSLYYQWLENSSSEDGIVAIPCLTTGNFFYFYFGLFRYTNLTSGKNITNQDGREIEIVGPGSGGDGDAAGARIPAP